MSYYTPGRMMDRRQTVAQIGRMNLLAISGGRVSPLGLDSILLPVSAGYRVRVTLAANDTYTVAREFVRKGKVHDHGVVEGVYCEEVGEVAYVASSFRSHSFGGVGA